MLNWLIRILGGVPKSEVKNTLAEMEKLKEQEAEQKELSATNANLEKENAELKAKVASLTAEVEKLKEQINLMDYSIKAGDMSIKVYRDAKKAPTPNIPFYVDELKGVVHVDKEKATSVSVDGLYLQEE